MRKVSVTGLNLLNSKEVKTLAKIISNSKFSSLEVLYIHGAREIGFGKYSEIFLDLLKKSSVQVFIDSFQLSEKDIKLIFEHSIKAKSLCLVNCEVANITSGFKISGKKFSLKTLDLFWTCIQDDKKFLSEAKTTNLFKALKGSKISSSLQAIHISAEDFDKNDIEDLQESYLPNVKLGLDDKSPEPMK
mmetsp:Transcript_2176/g.2509  ORF Transcript_2176/g.2509 Transcript_2176/m.2509 type:complete len:189 (-) Transcript_2176:43-609(-)